MVMGLTKSIAVSRTSSLGNSDTFTCRWGKITHDTIPVKRRTAVLIEFVAHELLAMNCLHRRRRRRPNCIGAVTPAMCVVLVIELIWEKLLVSTRETVRSVVRMMYSDVGVSN